MKVKRGCLIVLFIVIFVLFVNVMEVNAVNTGFKTNQLPDEEKYVLVSNINILPIDQEPVKKTISCIDVNENRLIAIGQNTSDRKTICIYSNDGVFQYGYNFNCSGDFGVEWDNENLNIFLVRSSVIVSVTPKGEIVDVFEVQNTIENNSYVNNFIHSTKRTVGDIEYSIRNNLGILNFVASSYSQVIIQDDTGAESVIYDVSSMQLSNMMVTIIFVCGFVLIAVAVIVWQLIKLKRERQSGDGSMIGS